MKTLKQLMLEIKYVNKEKSSLGGLKSGQRKADKAMGNLVRKKKEGTITKAEYNRLQKMMNKWYGTDIKTWDDYKNENT